MSNIENGKVSRREEIEEYLVSLAVQYYDKIKNELTKIDLAWISSPAVAKILNKLMSWGEKEVFKIQVLAKSLPPELQAMLDQTYLRDLSRVEDPLKEWEKGVSEVRELYVKAELKKLTSAITLAENKGEEITELQARFVSLSRSLSGIM